MDEKILKLLSQLKEEEIFYGIVSSFKKNINENYINMDLFTETTNEMDYLMNKGMIKDFIYTFELFIETVNPNYFNNRNELYKLKIVDNKNTSHNVFDGIIWFNINKKYDKINPFNYKKIRFCIERVNSNEKSKYLTLIKENFNNIRDKLIIRNHLNIKTINDKHIVNPDVYYSQYHVGLGNCSYININGITRGFFNIGFSNIKKGKNFPYYGFSRHKPDWIIISNLNINNYRAAIRYGNHNILSSDWIMPFVEDIKINSTRLFNGIINNGGKIYLIKYKANSSVVSLKVDNVKMRIYFTSEYDSYENGLCLYLEKNSKFISVGNSDYNFMKKLLVPQNFDVLVLSSENTKIKTKVSLNKSGGFRVYRTDNKGTFKCKF